MPIRVLIVVILAAVVVSGCGRRGSLEEPGAVATQQNAPAPLTDGISPLDPGAPAAAQEQTPNPPAPPAKRRFFLDFLL